jgi:hypothetical protein
MSKFLCKCDTVIPISGAIPNPIEWLIISDQAYDNYSGNIDSEKLYSEMRSFLKCEKCGRLWFFWDGYDHPPKLYAPEDY